VTVFRFSKANFKPPSQAEVFDFFFCKNLWEEEKPERRERREENGEGGGERREERG